MSYTINDEIIEKVRDASDIVDIISRYVALKKSGSNYVGLCPFHNEKTPSFTVSHPKQLFHCFGCGEGGDVISFIMKMENLTFPEAIKYLADISGIPLEEKKVDKKLEKEKEKIYEINKEAARFYYYNLINNKKALMYLKNRNINKRVLNQFGLGYAQDSWNNMYEYLKNKGYDDLDIEKTGLIGRRRDDTGYYDKFRNRIMFPIIDTMDRVIGFGGRVLDNSMPKYLNSKDTLVFIKGNNLYGLNLVKRQSNREKIILVEGYMDVIALFNYGINYAVASLGTAFTRNQGKLIKRYGKEVYICYDSDSAGINATIKVLNMLMEEGVEPKVIVLPSGQDPDDFINKNGLKEFEKLMDKALNFIEYQIYINKLRFNLADPKEKIGFTKEIAKALKKLKSPIEKDVYIDKISLETGISKEAIKSEVFGKNYKGNTTIYKDKYIKKGYRDNKSKIIPIKIVLEPAHLTAEKTLIKLMMENYEYFNIIKEYLKEEDFFSYECNVLACFIFEQYENNKQLTQIDTNSILEKIKNIKNIDMTVIEEILSNEVSFSHEDKYVVIKDLINTVEFSKLKLEREQVAKEIQRIEASKDKDEGDVNELKLLCLRLTEIDKQLESYK